MDKIIRVEGKGIIRRKPDVIRLSFNLKTENEKYEAAIIEYNEHNEKLVGAVTATGLMKEDIKTTNLHVGTHYEQEHDGKFYKNVFKGYQITSKLDLEMPMDLNKLSQLIEEITRGGTTPEFSITFGVSDEDRALEEALKSMEMDVTPREVEMERRVEVIYEIL